MTLHPLEQHAKRTILLGVFGANLTTHLVECRLDLWPQQSYVPAIVWEGGMTLYVSSSRRDIGQCLDILPGLG